MPHPEEQRSLTYCNSSREKGIPAPMALISGYSSYSANRRLGYPSVSEVIGTNRNQSEPIGVNRNQSEPIGTNRNQSESIGANRINSDKL